MPDTDSLIKEVDSNEEKESSSHSNEIISLEKLSLRKSQIFWKKTVSDKKEHRRTKTEVFSESSLQSKSLRGADKLKTRYQLAISRESIL